MKKISSIIQRFVFITLGMLLLFTSGAYLFYNQLHPGTQLSCWLKSVYATHTGQDPIHQFAQNANAEIKDRGGDMILLLQTDERWKDTPYGSGSVTNDLATNGCAITSLAMVRSFYEGREVAPTEILDWSKNNYYISGQGTAWSIFPDFAAKFGLNCTELGTNPEHIQAALNAGDPVVISVKPGEFTNVGHIMVLKNDLQGNLILYDPNDAADKRHFEKPYTLTQILDQTAGAWQYSS